MDETAAELAHWRLERDGEGIAWLCFDRRDSGANTLSRETMAGLRRVLDELEAQPPAGLVIWSGKESGFIAGADIGEFPALAAEGGALELVRHGQQLLDRLEALPCPSVAVLNGHALGGGLELALACTHRLAFAGSRPTIGLPEVQLGVHPGFGGTVRAPLLIGVRKAMELMLTGRSLRPAEALEAGLVDALTGPDTWREDARRWLRRPAKAGAPLLDRLLALPALRPTVARRLEAQVARRAPKAHYPAPWAMVDLWEKHGAAKSPPALEAEAESFARLVQTPTSRNLVRVYFLRERLKKLGGRGNPIRRVHVIGAGVMGGDIAAWCAFRGLDVTLEDRGMQYIEPALARAGKWFARKLREPGELAATRDRLRADPEGAGAADADVVIEAVFEDLEVKRSVYERVEPKLKPGALLATNTSSIPLEALAGCLADSSRLVGLHFFNPVAKLPLVEVVSAAGTAGEASKLGLAFARGIGKLPLPCRSHPGFLVNRILAPYIGEAMELLREGVPPAVIDHAAVAFGMPVGPVELADSVGLDVARHVARILSPVLSRPVAPEIEELVERGHLGVKTGQGFYSYRDGRPVRPPFPEGEGDPEVRERLVLALLNEAATCLHEQIVADADLVDAGVVFGTGFAPFRGGPLNYVREAGPDNIVRQLAALAQRHGPRFSPSPGFGRLTE